MSEWISVKDRLPENQSISDECNEYVRVYTEVFGEMHAMYCDGKWYYNYAIKLDAIVIFAIAVLRRDSNRSGIQRDTKSIDNIGKGIGRLRESEQRIKEHLDDAEDRTEIIERHNKSAKDGIKSVKRILERAKKRSDNP